MEKLWWEVKRCISTLVVLFARQCWGDTWAVSAPYLRPLLTCGCSLPAATPYLWLLLTCGRSLPEAAPYLWPLLTCGCSLPAAAPYLWLLAATLPLHAGWVLGEPASLPAPAISPLHLLQSHERAFLGSLSLSSWRGVSPRDPGDLGQWDNVSFSTSIPHEGVSMELLLLR